MRRIGKLEVQAYAEESGGTGMNINTWKLLKICGGVIAVILLYAAAATFQDMERGMTLVAGVGMANFSVLAAIVERLDRNYKSKKEESDS